MAASGSPLTMDSGVLTTAGAGDLLFAGGESNGKSIGRLTRGFKKRLGKYGNVTAEEAGAAAGPHEITATQKGTAWVMQLVAFRTAGSTPPNTAYPLKVGADRSLPGRSAGRAVPHHRRFSPGVDRQPVGGGGRLILRRPPGGRLQRRLDQPAVRAPTPGDDPTAARTTASSRSPRTTTSRRRTTRTSRASTTCSPSRPSTASTVFLDPAETGSWLSVLSSNGVDEVARLRPVPRQQVSQRRQHRLDERQRLPDLAESGRRRGGAGGRRAASRTGTTVTSTRWSSTIPSAARSTTPRGRR